MTVAELIEQLQLLPQDAQVCVGHTCPAERVRYAFGVRLDEERDVVIEG